MKINKVYLSEMVQHCQKDYPNEACGILAGKDGKIERIYRMTNADKSSKTFFMGPKEQLKVMKEIRNVGLEMVGIYHSHPETEAYPSAYDVELAFYPEVSYVIVSLKDKNSPNIRSFKIEEGKITEEDLKIEATNNES
ncbi:M67 family metallopeptidase [bacterium]|nr:M67 family metallopeptidase [bacterium]